MEPGFGGEGPSSRPFEAQMLGNHGDTESALNALQAASTYADTPGTNPVLVHVRCRDRRFDLAVSEDETVLNLLRRLSDLTGIARPMRVGMWAELLAIGSS